MSFQKYYLEIKYRIFLLGFTWVVAVLVSYIYKEVVLSVVVNNSTIKMSYFIFTDVVEVFTVYLLLTFFVGNQILVLYFLYHFLFFILPSLTKSESNSLVYVSTMSHCLFIVSVLIFNKLLFPLSWDFFLSFKNFDALKSLSLHFEAKLLEYVVFYINFYYVCVLYFQVFLIPILIFKYIKKELQVYRHFRKFLYYFCLTFSTIVTPPDVTSQAILGFSIIISCEILVYYLTFQDVLEKR
jgi:sec-independent protein translocase protein TatC